MRSGVRGAGSGDGSELDDVRVHALGLLHAVVGAVLGRARGPAAPSVHAVLAEVVEPVVMCLVGAAAHFRSPDARTRAVSLRTAMKVCLCARAVFLPGVCAAV